MAVLDWAVGAGSRGSVVGDMMTRETRTNIKIMAVVCDVISHCSSHEMSCRGWAGQFFLSDGRVYKNRRVEKPPVTRRVDFCKPEHNWDTIGSLYPGGWILEVIRWAKKFEKGPS